MASSSSSSASPPPPPTPPVPSAAKKTFLRRILPVLLAANVAVAVYVLTRTSMNKSTEKNEDGTEKVPSSPTVSTEVTEKTVTAEIPAPKKVLPPVPEHEQHELFKWILEEKRKVKPHDSSEKKKIDEEKALLKQIIRSKSIPSL